MAQSTTHPILRTPEGMDSSDFCKLWNYCPTCGAPVLINDTTTTCEPQQVRKHAKYLRKLAKREVIKTRMADRERKFREAQARDERALYKLERS
jgi:hypothetical protein